MKIYTASKLNHAQRWIDLHDSGAVKVTSRWLRVEHVAGLDPYDSEAVRDAAFMSRCWIEDEEDVRAADAVLVYGEPGENLRGALVEAGMGIALGKPVLVVGENENFGTWQHHPLCRKFETVEAALQWCRQHREKAKALVERIIADLTDRKGLRHVWDTFADDIQDEIIECWRQMALEALEEAAS